MRLDAALVALGLAPSRSRAHAMIAAGKVWVDGRPALKASEAVTPAQTLEAEPDHPWVSRGGVKLDHALQVFGVDPTGRTCLERFVTLLNRIGIPIRAEV
jgi:23S rRNA (cytidine1920-2'-O)/16S rRNA (cytidine1409-2'-O)-methyltransferase